MRKAVLLTLSLPPLWADRVRLRQLLKALRSGPPALPPPAHLPPHSPPHPHGTAHGPGPHETR